MAQDNNLPGGFQLDQNAAAPQQEQLPEGFELDQPKERGFVAGAQRGAEQVAGAVKGIPSAIGSAWEAAKRDNARPQMDVAKDAVNAVKQIPGKVKGMADAADQAWQDDPGGFVGQFLTSQVVPAAIGGALGKASPALRVSEDVKLAAQQANANPVKEQLLHAQVAAKQTLNQKMNAVIGQVDKSPAMMPRSTVYSEMTKFFDDDLKGAPVDVSRLIKDSTKERGLVDANGQAIGSDSNMRFGQLDNIRQAIGHSMRADPGNTALKGAYAKVTSMLDEVAGKQGLAEKYKEAKAAIEDFHTNVVPKGGIIDRATKPTSEDYNDIMQPLTSPATAEKVRKLKELGAQVSPQEIAARVKAYKLYQKHGGSIWRHSLQPLNLLEAGGGVAGFAMGSAAGHPYLGAELGIQGTRALRNKLSDTPMPAMPPE